MNIKANERLFQLLTIIAGGFAACRPIVDPDLWWHLTVGRWILAHRQVPSHDLWNMFGAGKPWRAYSWCNEVLFAAVYGLGGELGLAFLKLLLSLAIAGAVIGCFSAMSKDRFFGSCLGILVLAGASDNFTLRPQSFSWIFFVLVIFLAHRLSEEGLNARRLGYLSIVMALWANTHITTVFGLVVAFTWLARRGSTTTIIHALVVCAVAFIATLATPYFGGEWMTTQSKALHPILHQSIAEFQPATIFFYNAGILAVMFVLLLSLLQRQPKSLELPRVLLCALFVVLALTAVKWIPYALILLGASIACAWSRVDSTGFGNVAKQVEQLRHSLTKIPSAVLCLIALVIIARSGVRLVKEPVRENAFPVRAVDFIEQHHLPHPVLNTFGDGGYLMFRFSDAQGNALHRVPIDGRTNVNDGEVMLAHEAAFLGTKRWKRYLELVNPGTVLWESGLALTSLLEIHPDWCLLYSDPPADDKHQPRSWNVFVQKSLLHGLRPEIIPPQCAQQL